MYSAGRSSLSAFQRIPFRYRGGSPKLSMSLMTYGNLWITDSETMWNLWFWYLEKWISPMELITYGWPWLRIETYGLWLGISLRISHLKKPPHKITINHQEKSVSVVLFPLVGSDMDGPTPALQPRSDEKLDTWMCITLGIHEYNNPYFIPYIREGYSIYSSWGPGPRPSTFPHPS